MSYLEIQIKAEQNFYEIFTAELAELGFDTFQEENGFLMAYGEMLNVNKASVEQMIDSYNSLTEASYTFAEVQKENWNEEWEKNFQPIFVEDQCVVRASFHQIEQNYPYEIIITPKMSFGTGHHATTYLMLLFLLEQDLTGKQVVDLGCGTGILSIMAVKKGAARTEACDVDDWCIENSEENFSLNNTGPIKPKLGTALDCFKKADEFDVVLANINKNVLLSEMPHYAGMLKTEGELFLSGFYERDIPDLISRGKECGLNYIEQKAKDDWASIRMVKNT